MTPDRIQRVLITEEEGGPDVYEVCPVCMEPWGDIHHTVSYVEIPKSDPVRFVLVCSRSVET